MPPKYKGGRRLNKSHKDNLVSCRTAKSRPNKFVNGELTREASDSPTEESIASLTVAAAEPAVPPRSDARRNCLRSLDPGARPASTSDVPKGSQSEGEKSTPRSQTAPPSPFSRGPDVAESLNSPECKPVAAEALASVPGSLLPGGEIAESTGVRVNFSTIGSKPKPVLVTSEHDLNDVPSFKDASEDSESAFDPDSYFSDPADELVNDMNGKVVLANEVFVPDSKVRLNDSDDLSVQSDMQDDSDFDVVTGEVLNTINLKNAVRLSAMVLTAPDGGNMSDSERKQSTSANERGTLSPDPQALTSDTDYHDNESKTDALLESKHIGKFLATPDGEHFEKGGNSLSRDHADDHSAHVDERSLQPGEAESHNLSFARESSAEKAEPRVAQLAIGDNVLEAGRQLIASDVSGQQSPDDRPAEDSGFKENDSSVLAGKATTEIAAFDEEDSHSENAESLQSATAQDSAVSAGLSSFDSFRLSGEATQSLDILKETEQQGVDSATADGSRGTDETKRNDYRGENLLPGSHTETSEGDVDGPTTNPSAHILKNDCCEHGFNDNAISSDSELGLTKLDSGLDHVDAASARESEHVIEASGEGPELARIDKEIRLINVKSSPLEHHLPNTLCEQNAGAEGGNVMALAESRMNAEDTETTAPCLHQELPEPIANQQLNVSNEGHFGKKNESDTGGKAVLASETEFVDATLPEPVEVLSREVRLEDFVVNSTSKPLSLAENQNVKQNTYSTDELTGGDSSIHEIDHFDKKPEVSETVAFSPDFDDIPNTTSAHFMATETINNSNNKSAYATTGSNGSDYCDKKDLHKIASASHNRVEKAVTNILNHGPDPLAGLHKRDGEQDYAPEAVLSRAHDAAALVRALAEGKANDAAASNARRRADIHARRMQINENLAKQKFSGTLDTVESEASERIEETAIKDETYKDATTESVVVSRISSAAPRVVSLNATGEDISSASDANGNENLILGVCVVGFHHARGPEVEYWVGANGDQSHVWPYLPFQSLPDGSHSFEENLCYFTLLYDTAMHRAPNPTPERDADGHIIDASDFNSVVTYFAMACSRQLSTQQMQRVPAKDVTRSTIQKSVVVIARKPIFGPIKEKLTVVTRSYFEQGDFNDRRIIDNLYENLVHLFSVNVPDSDFYVGTQLREFVYRFQSQVLVLFKALLLENKIFFYSTDTDLLCNFQFALISLVPDLLNHLQDCGSPLLSSYETRLKKPNQLKSSDRESLLKYMGLPLQVFAGGGLFNPFVPLQQIEELKQKETQYGLVGSTNHLFLTSGLHFDVVVNIDAGTIDIDNSAVKALLNLTTADRLFMESICKAVIDSWDADNTWQPRSLKYQGSDDYIRHQFEDYVLGLLSSAKYDLFLQSNGPPTPRRLFGREAITSPLKPFGTGWAESWKQTNNYRIFNKFTAEELFDIVEPVHVGEPKREEAKTPSPKPEREKFNILNIFRFGREAEQPAPTAGTEKSM